MSISPITPVVPCPFDPLATSCGRLYSKVTISVEDPSHEGSFIASVAWQGDNPTPIFSVLVFVLPNSFFFGFVHEDVKDDVKGLWG
jgi:hypothetical protein